MTSEIKISFFNVKNNYINNSNIENEKQEFLNYINFGNRPDNTLYSDIIILNGKRMRKYESEELNARIFLSTDIIMNINANDINDETNVNTFGEYFHHQWHGLWFGPLIYVEDKNKNYIKELVKLYINDGLCFYENNAVRKHHLFGILQYTNICCYAYYKQQIYMKLVISMEEKNRKK